MPVTTRETQALAEILHIGITESEAERLARDMSAVLAAVRLPDSLDLADEPPATAGLSGYAELREDIPGESFSPADLEMLSAGRYDAQREAFVSKPIFG